MVVDTTGARVKTELKRNVFAAGVYTEEELTIIEPEKSRMLLANPLKSMCMRFDLKDVTPISLSHSQPNTPDIDDNDDDFNPKDNRV